MTLLNGRSFILCICCFEAVSKAGEKLAAGFDGGARPVVVGGAFDGTPSIDAINRALTV